MRENEAIQGQEAKKSVYDTDQFAQAQKSLLLHLEQCTLADADAKGKRFKWQADDIEKRSYTIKKDYARWFWALLALWQEMREKPMVLAAIDGRCGSGKTTLAKCVAEVFPCRVFHADDFYLPLKQRCAGWEKKPAANMDLDRLQKQVLEPASQGKEVVYIPYRCQMGDYGEAQAIPFAPLTLVEGSYSQHPELAQFYDLKLFLNCENSTQETRLRAREGQRFAMFASRWIPLEETYITQYSIAERANMCLDTTPFPAQKIPPKE